jgi:hypothetical protein
MQYLISRRQINGKFSQWIVILQEYDLEFSTPKRKKSLILDELIMTFPSDTTSSPINTNFPDEHLFYIPLDDPWYDDLLATYEHKNSETTSPEMIVNGFVTKPHVSYSLVMFYIGEGSTLYSVDA